MVFVLQPLGVTVGMSDSQKQVQEQQELKVGGHMLFCISCLGWFPVISGWFCHNSSIAAAKVVFVVVVVVVLSFVTALSKVCCCFR